MNIKAGEEEKYAEWYRRALADPCKKKVVEAILILSQLLDAGNSADSVVLLLNKCPAGIDPKDLGYIALALSIFHQRGTEFQFAWNSYWKGRSFASEQRLSERVYNPYL